MIAQETTIIMSSYYLAIALLSSILAYIGPRTLLFGIALPVESVHDAAVQGIRRNYVFLTGGLAVVIGGACFLVTRHLTASQSILYWTTAILLLSVASGFAIWISRISAQRLKTARGWQVVVQTKRTASLAVSRTHRSVLGPWWYSAHAAVMALCIFCAVVRWNEIPQWFATHMGPNGIPEHYTYKSVRSVFMLNILQALNIALFAGYNLMIGRTRTSLDPQDREGSLQKQLKLKKIHSMMVWSISLLIVAFLGLTQATRLYGWKLDLLFRYSLLFQVMFYLTPILVLLYLRFRGLDQHRDVPSQEERHWKWLGSIYANPEDPALLVPDRYGFMWTINMANPRSKIIIAAALAFMAAPILVFIYFK